MSALAELSIFPLDKGASLSPYVARAVRIIEDSGLPFAFGPMGTSIEGEWDEVMAVVKRCLDDLAEDCERISVQLKVDWRRGPAGRITDKVRSVQHKLEKP